MQGDMPYGPIEGQGQGQCWLSKFFSSHLHEIRHIATGRWVMHDGMRYSRIEGQGQGKPFKVWIPSIFNIYLLRHLQRELANDH